jgi:hypothetical protein
LLSIIDPALNESNKFGYPTLACHSERSAAKSKNLLLATFAARVGTGVAFQWGRIKNPENALSPKTLRRRSSRVWMRKNNNPLSDFETVPSAIFAQNEQKSFLKWGKFQPRFLSL